MRVGNKRRAHTKNGGREKVRVRVRVREKVERERGLWVGEIREEAAHEEWRAREG